MRLPVIPDISSRDGSSTKNARMYNVLAEKRPSGGIIAQVRPGLTSVSENGTKNGNGLVNFDGRLVSVFATDLIIADVESDWVFVAATINSGALTFVCSSGAFAMALSTHNPSHVFTSFNGSSWAQQSNAPFVNTFSTGFLPMFPYDNDIYVYTKTDHYLYKTADGVTWETIGEYPTSSIDYPDNVAILVIGSVFHLYNLDEDTSQCFHWTSSDFGATWTVAADATGLGSIVSGAAFFTVDGTVFWFGGGSGNMYSTNDGLSFNVVNLASGTSAGYYLNGFFYGYDAGEGGASATNDEYRWIVGRSAVATGLTVGDFIDGGESWNPFLVAGTPYFLGAYGVYKRQVTAAGGTLGLSEDAIYDFAQSTT